MSLIYVAEEAQLTSHKLILKAIVSITFNLPQNFVTLLRSLLDKNNFKIIAIVEF